MADIKYIDGTHTVVINTDATLANNVRAAADYANGTNLDLYADFFLVVTYSGSAPTAGTIVGELYVLPSDGAGSPAYPQGGSATVGTDVDPQKSLLRGVFESRSPSTSVAEILAVTGVPLAPRGNRIVFKNTSGRTFANTWELRMKTYRLQTV